MIMLVFGRNVAKAVLNKDIKVKKVYLQDKFKEKEIISLIEKKKFEVKIVSKNEMDRLCSGLHQGIVMDIPDYNYDTLDDFLKKEEDLVIILDHLEDPHNLGAIIRTCEAAGIKSIILPKDRQVLVNSTVMKTSVGTLLDVSLVMVSNLNQAINHLKEEGYWIVGTSLDESIDYREIDYSGKTALVIGNEGMGISNLVSKNCDFLAKIPMYGKTNSLNASVAAGIMIYEMIRNRK